MHKIVNSYSFFAIRWLPAMCLNSIVAFLTLFSKWPTFKIISRGVLDLVTSDQQRASPDRATDAAAKAGTHHNHSSSPLSGIDFSRSTWSAAMRIRARWRAHTLAPLVFIKRDNPRPRRGVKEGKTRLSLCGLFCLFMRLNFHQSGLRIKKHLMMLLSCSLIVSFATLMWFKNILWFRGKFWIRRRMINYPVKPQWHWTTRQNKTTCSRRRDNLVWSSPELKLFSKRFTSCVTNTTAQLSSWYCGPSRDQVC